MDININEWVLLVRNSLYWFGGLGPEEPEDAGLLHKGKIKLATVIEPREDEYMNERILGVIQLSEVNMREAMVEWPGQLGWDGKMSWEEFE